MKKFKRVIASICAVMMIMLTFAATTVAATPKEQEQIEAISEADIAVACLCFVSTYFSFFSKFQRLEQ